MCVYVLFPFSTCHRIPPLRCIWSIFEILGRHSITAHRSYLIYLWQSLTSATDIALQPLGISPPPLTSLTYIEITGHRYLGIYLWHLWQVWHLQQTYPPPPEAYLIYLRHLWHTWHFKTLAVFDLCGDIPPITALRCIWAIFDIFEVDSIRQRQLDDISDIPDMSDTWYSFQITI